MSLDCLAERPSNWRLFNAGNGLQESYAASVSVSRLGNVWVKHGDADQISVFDGYRIQTMPSPGHDYFRIYESRNGQLWSLYSGGLVVSVGGPWVAHPITEIRDEIKSDPLRQLRQIPLVPADRDHVLFLLADKLMEYDSAARQAVVLKQVADTSLGKFLEMNEARDGGIWITGTKGAAKFAGNPRYLRPGAPCREFLVPDSLHAENLQRPFEDASGALTVAATDALTTGTRVVLRLEGGSWSARPVEMANIRQAWPAWDNTTWAYTINSLLSFDPPPLNTMSREKIWAGQFKDIATETNGIFWLATSEGLLRYAPFLWRAPIELEEMSSHVHAIAQDGRDRLWFAGSDALIGLEGNRVRTVKWPDGVEGSFEPRDNLYSLPDGHLAIAAGGRIYLFDPEADQFQALTHPSGHRCRVLGQLADGALAVQRTPPEVPAGPGFVLERCDSNGFEPWIRSPAEWTFGAEVFFVTPLANGDIWIGGSEGLARLRNGQFDLFGPGQGFRESRALCLAEIGGGKLWCGGSSRILEFNGKSWSIVRSSFDRINGIARGPDENPWLATANGLFSYGNGTWVQHGMEEGLPSVGISSVFLDRSQHLWAGTTRGLSQFHPDADLYPPKTRDPVFENAQSSQVPAEQSTLLLTAIDKWQQTPTERLLYATRLDSAPWSAYTNSPTKVFEALGAGKHRVEVKAMDRNRNEDPYSAALDFYVVLAWNKDPRLIGSVVSGAVLVLLFASLAVNRHLRLIRSYAEVEKMVAVRTRELELANEQLLQSQKMKALGTLAAGIAHDFNNILSIIKGSAQIIQSNLEDKQKILTRLSRIQAVVEQGSGIVRSILGLSRVKEKDLAQADLNRIVEEAIKLISDRFMPAVTILLNPAPGLPPVNVAKELIQQMLLNLILNAADAMDHCGEIRLSTGIHEHLQPDLALSPARASRYLYVSVQDDGCGIAPDILPRVFEPFFTTKALSARRGTGLGLSMVYELARQMGYGLEVRSTQGQGSTFTILLPVSDASSGSA